jgi:hypothetical protein
MPDLAPLTPFRRRRRRRRCLISLFRFHFFRHTALRLQLAVIFADTPLLLRGILRFFSAASFSR